MERCSARVSALTLLKMSTNSEYLVGMKLPFSVIVISASMHAQLVNVGPSHILGNVGGEKVFQEVWYRRPVQWKMTVVHRSPLVTRWAGSSHSNVSLERLFCRNYRRRSLFIACNALVPYLPRWWSPQSLPADWCIPQSVGQMPQQCHH